MNAFLEEDVPDPTDFAPEADAPGLRALDEAVRCTICREHFEAPVTVNCSHGHCFCSLCIREQMTIKQECPLCRQPIVEAHLRRNPALEDILKAWKAARPFVLSVLEERQHPMLVTPLTRSPEPVLLASPSKKRRRQASVSSDEDIMEVAGPSKPVSLHQRLPSTPKKKPSSTSRGSAGYLIVECPICSQRIRADTADAHIENNCQTLILGVSPGPKSIHKTRSVQKREWSRLFGGEASSGSSLGKGKMKKRATTVDLDAAEPIPKMAYDTLAAKTIRERLNEYSLPTEGEKAVLVTRHQRWVTMFNANLDASPAERKTLPQLRQELKKREEADRVRKPQQTPVDLDTYERNNKMAFAQLIEKARPKSPRKAMVNPNVLAPPERSSKTPDDVIPDDVDTPLIQA